MDFKRSMLILILAIFFVSIAGVCASDVNDTAVASEDNLEIDNADDVIGVGADTNLTSSEENEILTDGEKTFGQLNEAINGNNDKDVYLSGNYKYSSGDDSFKEGIAIRRDVNIYGNGATIDGNKEARIFKVYGGNVVFYNITFVNGNGEDNQGSAIYGNCKAINCRFKENHANQGGAMYGGSAVNCSFSGNTANQGGAMYGGSAVLCIFETSSDTLYNTNINIPTFTVSKSFLRFDHGDRLLFNLTYDNKNYDGYNTTISLTKDGNPVGVYYALSGSDEGWFADLSSGIYVATLSMEQYAVNPITVDIITGMNVDTTYFGLMDEIGDGGNINLTESYYNYTGGHTIEIKNSGVINGNGAVIDMAGSNIRAFYVSASGVTIRNLTIKNADVDGDGGAIYFGVAGTVENCTFIGNNAFMGGAIRGGSAVNCSFSGNTANYGGAMYGGSAVLCIFETSSDTLYNTNIPTFAVSKSFLRFDHGDRLLFNLTYDNKNYDGYNTTITLTKDGNQVGVYYALSGSDEGWFADLSPGIYVATLSMEQYAVNPITVDIITGNAGTYSELSGEIGSGGDIINLQYGYYTYDYGSSIEISKSLTVINGNGAVIDMAGSNIRAFYVSASGVTIRNLTIKNAYFDGDGGAIYFGVAGTVENCTFIGNNAFMGGAIRGGSAVNCIFTGNDAFGGGAIRGGSAVNCTFSGNFASSQGGAMFEGSAVNCTFSGNFASSQGGAMYGGSAVNCSFSGNTANQGGAMYGGSAVNCSFSGNTANYGGAMYGGSAVLCIFETSSDTLYNTNIPTTFTVSKSFLRFDHGDRLLFNLTYDNKNYDGYNTTITLTKDGNPVGVYYALSGSDDGWFAELSPGIYMATLSMEQYAVNPITVEIITGMNVDPTTYFGLMDEIGDGGNINLTESYYNYTGGDTIEIKNSGVINGNGAVIDMAGSNIRAFYVSASGVTIRNLTIKNADVDGDGGAIYFAVAGTVENCTFINNTASADGGALSGGEAHNCSFVSNVANNGGAINDGKAYNCNFTGNQANGNGGAMYGGSAVLCILKTSSDTLYNTNIPTFAVFKSFFVFDLGDRLLFNLTYDNKNYDGYNTTIALTKDGNPVGVYYALSGSDEGWFVDLSPGIYMATLSMGQYAVNPITVDIITGMNVGTYSWLSSEIGSGGGVINLQYGNYIYDYGSSIEISKSLTVINGNGAVIDMAGSNIRAFTVSASGVTIRNLTIMNADVDGDGGAIYFGVAGTVENCTFIGNKANGGGAMYEGYAINCRFIENHANNGCGGAINGYNHKSVNCTFTSNTASAHGGALSGGEAHNCNFISNAASQNGGAINNGKAYNCNFTENHANENGGAMYDGSAVDCSFSGNTAEWDGGAMSGGSAVKCSFVGNSAEDGGAMYDGSAVDCSFSGNTAEYGGAISFGYKLNCIGQDPNDYYETEDLALWWDADNFNTPYGSVKKLPIALRGQNGFFAEFINYDVVIYKEGREVKTYHCLSNEGLSLDLAAGIYTAELIVTYPGLTMDSNYIILTINKATPKIEVQAYDATYPGSVVVNVKSDVGGVYVVGIGGKSQSVTLEAGVGENITFTGLPANESGYVINVTHNSENYTGFNDAVKVIVHKATPGIEVVAYDATYPGSVVVNVKSDVGGVYVVRVGDKSQSVTLNAGVGDNITFTGLAASEEGYVVNVTNLDVENCTAVVNDTVKVIVHKATPRIEVVAYDATYPGSVVVNVKSDVGGVYVVRIGDKSQSVTLNAGVGENITFAGLPANEGGYPVNVTCQASGNYTAGVNDTVVVKIRKASVIIISQEITATYNINRDLVITLKDSNGNPFVGVSLSVDLNGAKDYATDKNGQIKVPIKGLAAKTYTAKITFNGNANYASSAKSVKVTVKKATPKLTAKSKKFKKSIKVKKYTVTLKDNTGKAMKKVQLTIKIGKKTFKAKTNNKGKATFKIKKLSKKGKYKATVTYNGDKNYNKVTKKVKITVK